MDQNQNHLAQSRSWEQLCQCHPNPQCRRPRGKGMAWLWLWIGFHECNQKSVLMSFGVGRCNSRIQYLSKLCNAAIQIYSLYLLFSSSSSKTMRKIVFSNWKKRSLHVFFTNHFSMPRNIKTNIQALQGLVLLQGLCQSFRSVPLDVIVPNLNLHDTTSPSWTEECLDC